MSRRRRASTPPTTCTWFAAFHQIPALPERLVDGREPDYLGWFYTAFSATPGVPGPDAVAEYLRCYRRPGAMSSAFARYRGVEQEIAHHTTRPTPTIPVLAVGGALRRITAPRASGRCGAGPG